METSIFETACRLYWVTANAGKNEIHIVLIIRAEGIRTETKVGFIVFLMLSCNFYYLTQIL